ncbi:hypothetical protein D0817_25985, partial [Flavobacterium cupreum]
PSKLSAANCRRRPSSQLQRCARQTDRAHVFATELNQPGEHVLDAGAGLGDGVVAPLLCFLYRLVLRALALDVHAPALLRKSSFALTIDIAFVGQDV